MVSDVVDLERAKDDWFHGRRHVNCLTCNGSPWAHPSVCPTWAGPTEGQHLDPPCATCGRCEHLHQGVHRDRGRCAAFTLPRDPDEAEPLRARVAELESQRAEWLRIQQQDIEILARATLAEERARVAEAQVARVRALVDRFDAEHENLPFSCGVCGGPGLDAEAVHEALDGSDGEP